MAEGCGPLDWCLREVKTLERMARSAETPGRRVGLR